MGPYITIVLIIVIVVIALARNIRVVPQARASVIERLGA